MIDVKEAQKKLVEASKKLSILEKAAEDALVEDSLFKMPVFFSAAFPFRKDVLGKQEKTIVNGAEDAYITKIMYTPTEIVPVVDDPIPDLNPTQYGLFTTTVKAVNPSFEFRWNYRLASTQARYLSQANSVDLASRRSLGYFDVGLPLTLAKPLYFAAGDAIILEVECILNLPDPDDAVTRYYPQTGVSEVVYPDIGHSVHLTLCGYRTGTMV